MKLPDSTTDDNKHEKFLVSQENINALYKDSS